MRKITEIIIHCTATPQGREYTREQIDKMHRQRGFRCIGYHFLVHLDGAISTGRHIEEVGAHCLKHNANSVGIAYIGGLVDMETKKPRDTRTDSQKMALRGLVKRLKAQYPEATIHGHNEFSDKACPCFDVQKESWE